MKMKIETKIKSNKIKEKESKVKSIVHNYDSYHYRPQWSAWQHLVSNHTKQDTLETSLIFAI